MRLLCVSDLHYSLRQFDWLAENGSAYDLVIIAGDLLDMASSVYLDTQAAVVEQYLVKLAQLVPLVVCSGNHDLIQSGTGSATADWILDLNLPNVTVDGGVLENQYARFVVFPWWQEEFDKIRLEAFLKSLAPRMPQKKEIWVHHAPPFGTKVSWNGKRDLGEPALSDWIIDYQPDLVLSGHIHLAPYCLNGSWTDTIEKTHLTNGGQNLGKIPASIIIDLKRNSLVWHGMEGSERHPLS